MRSTWFIVAVGVFVVIQIIVNIGKNTENKQNSTRNANITVREEDAVKEENSEYWAETYRHLCDEKERLTKWRDAILNMERSVDKSKKAAIEARGKRGASGMTDCEFEKIYREMDKISDDMTRDSQNILDVEKRRFNNAVEGWNLQVKIFLSTSYARTVDTTGLLPMSRF